MPPLRVAFLWPAGTFSEDALRAATAGVEVDARPAASVHEAILSVADGGADRALVPFENAIEGSVRPTLDTLAFEARGVTIAGEHDHPIRHALIARTELELDAIETVVSHPQPSAQCARFLREELPGAELRAADSTADAVREVSESERPWAALGAASAAEIYGCVVLRDGVEDEHDNVTRFVWIAPDGVRAAGNGEWRTTLIFSELGADHPGALVDALTEFADREVNLVRIESRPLRRGLGRYMFFIDLDGADTDPVVAEAIGALRGKAESVRVLGSYPISPERLP
jgi:prephenate dehydratase